MSNIHFNSLVPRADCKLWDMLFLFWSGFCMAESWARRLSLCLACKPFPGLCACTWIGRWCASVVAIRSFSLFTNRADRRSQINSLDSWCATRVSKTLEVACSQICSASYALSNEAGASQFMTDFLPLTPWSQVPPVSLSVSLCV